MLCLPSSKTRTALTRSLPNETGRGARAALLFPFSPKARPLRRAFAFLEEYPVSAQHIYTSAPLGSLIRYSNGKPRPPARFRRKLRAWEHENGVGRLVERYPGYVSASFNSPPHFMLHLGDYGSQGTIVLTVRRAYGLDSSLHFEIVETPRAGSVRILTSVDGRDELRHLASNLAAAESWMQVNRYSNMRTEIVSDQDPVILPPTTRRAA